MAVYTDAVTLAQMEMQAHIDTIPLYSFFRRKERRAYSSTIKALDAVLTVDEHKAMSAIVTMTLRAKLILNEDDELYKIIVRMMVDIGKKMGPGGEMSIEFPFD